MLFNLNDLLVAKEILITSALNSANKLKDKYSDAFVLPPKGIYVRGTVKPVLEENKQYYSEESYKTQTALKSLDDVTSSILDSDGNVLIPRFAMANKKKFISTKPFYPLIELEVVKYVVAELINQFVCYPKDEKIVDKLYDLVKSDYHYLVDEGYLELCIHSSCQEIMNFMGNDDWNIYFVNLKNTDLIIEKSTDFRVYEWTRYMNEEKIGFEK